LNLAVVIRPERPACRALKEGRFGPRQGAQVSGRLDGKVAIVTGADSGIGRAIAIEFAQEGAHVAITWLRDREGAADTARQVHSAGRRPAVLQVDVRDPDDVARLFRETEQQLGTPYILVNNAGISGPMKPVADLSIEDWDDVLKTNLYGPFYCCQHFIRARRVAGGRGKIINVTSVHEDIPMVGGGAYDASKGGLRNLTRTLCLELAPDRINVNNLAPGMVLRPMNQEAIDNLRLQEEQVQHIPLKRAAEPWEMAKLALYLASEDADYASGQTFFLDGGLTMNVGQGA
jgi:glucose 1-dehydrogenase